MKQPILTVVGCRPQFVKAAAVSRHLHKYDVEEVLLHTGQHYDGQLVDAIWTDVGFQPHIELKIGSGSHAWMLAKMLIELEQVFVNVRPRLVIVYGDTNSSLAAALVASKLEVPIVHVEAGCRSGDRSQPEEVNRVAIDHMSELLCFATDNCLHNAAREGLSGELTGDVMLDVLAGYELGPSPEGHSWNYGVVTIHRASNTDDLTRLKLIVEALGQIDCELVWPVHPRLHDRLKQELPENITAIPAEGHRRMLTLVRDAKFVVTDSGGLQKEAAWLGTPCFTMRTRTEWTDTVSRGVNKLVSPVTLPAAVAAVQQTSPLVTKALWKLYGEGVSGVRVARCIADLYDGN